MATVAVDDGNPVKVNILVSKLTSPTKGFASLFSSAVSGGFVQSGSGDDQKFTAVQKLPNADLTIHLTGW